MKNTRQKGSRFERYLVNRLLEVDGETKRTFMSGQNLDKGDLRMPALDFNVEAKNAKQVNLCKDFKQAEDQCVSGGIPVLMIRNPKLPEFHQTFVVMDLEDWMELVNGNTVGETTLPDNLKWKIKRLKDSAHEVFKELN